MLPTNPTESFVRLNPHIYNLPSEQPIKAKRVSQSSRYKLNATEQRWLEVLVGRGYTHLRPQSITLTLDPPFRSYRADIAHIPPGGQITLWEVKAPHRFREKGVAKAALAAKTYPMFNFILVDWTSSGWVETLLGGQQQYWKQDGARQTQEILK